MKLQFNTITDKEQQQELYKLTAEQLLATLVGTAPNYAGFLGNLAGFVKLIIRLYKDSANLNDEAEKNIKEMVVKLIETE